MINWERVNELRRDIGNDGFDEVLELFLEEMDERIVEIQRSGFSNKDEDLHFLKGCAANVGFAKMVELSVRPEQGSDVSAGQIVDCYAASKKAFFKQLQDETA